MASNIVLAIEAIRALQTIRYTRLVANVAIIYDHMITFDAEVNLVWSSKWSIAKLLFFMIRYYTLGAVVLGTYGLFTPSLTNSVCTNFFRWELVTTFLSSILTEGVLQIRVYALYYKNRKTLAFILGAYAITTAFSSWILYSEISAGKSLVYDLPTGMTCTFPPLPPRAFGLWVPFNVYEAILCALVMYRGYTSFTYDRAHKGLGRTLLDIMVRDSLFVFMLLTVGYLTGMVLWVKLTKVYIEIPAGFIIAMSCILSSRMILNLREAAMKRKRTSVSTTFELSTIT